MTSVVFERCENQVHVIGHHNRDVQPHLEPVVVQAVFQHTIAHAFWKHPVPVGAEGDEYRPPLLLNMG
jgi:hypothetical protein